MSLVARNIPLLERLLHPNISDRSLLADEPGIVPLPPTHKGLGLELSIDKNINYLAPHTLVFIFLFLRQTWVSFMVRQEICLKLELILGTQVGKKYSKLGLTTHCRIGLVIS